MTNPAILKGSNQRLLNETQNLLYEVTISPPYRTEWEKLHLANPTSSMYHCDKMRIRHWCKQAGLKRYVFYPELTEKGRLHYHGIIRFDRSTRTTFFKSTQFKFKLLGLTQYKPLNTFVDLLRWTIYMHKDWGYTRDILEENYPINSWEPKAYIKKYYPSEGVRGAQAPVSTSLERLGPKSVGPECPKDRSTVNYFTEYYEDFK